MTSSFYLGLTNKEATMEDSAPIVHALVASSITIVQRVVFPFITLEVYEVKGSLQGVRSTDSKI